ncbi:unnamed protein product [Effrenium voratum]|nr:unnamed protein product [Effrenium voratum]
MGQVPVVGCCASRGRLSSDLKGADLEVKCGSEPKAWVKFKADKMSKLGCIQNLREDVTDANLSLNKTTELSAVFEEVATEIPISFGSDSGRSSRVTRKRRSHTVTFAPSSRTKILESLHAQDIDGSTRSAGNRRRPRMPKEALDTEESGASEIGTEGDVRKLCQSANSSPSTLLTCRHGCCQASRPNGAATTDRLFHMIRRERHTQKRLLTFLAEHHFTGVNNPRSTVLGFYKEYPLHAAVRCLDAELVKMLLRNGADPSVRDGSRMTPWQRAWSQAKKGSEGACDVLAVLEAHEARRNRRKVVTA